MSHGAPSRVLYPELASTYLDCAADLDKIPSQPDFPNAYPAMKRFRIGRYAVFSIEADPQAAVQFCLCY